MLWGLGDPIAQALEKGFDHFLLLSLGRVVGWPILSVSHANGISGEDCSVRPKDPMSRELYSILMLTCASSSFKVRTSTTVGLGIYHIGATVGLARDNPKLSSFLDPSRTGYL